MDATRDLLLRFAKETRHRDHQLENVGQIARKFLATQVPHVQWRTVYPFVSSDLGSIDFRAPHVLDEYATVRDISPAVYNVLLGDQIEKGQIPFVDTFCEQVRVPIEKGLVYFFLTHRHTPTDLESLEPDLRERQRIHDAINHFDFDVDALEAAQQLGQFIAQLSFEALEKATPLFYDESTPLEDLGEDNLGEETKVPDQEVKDPIVLDEERLRRNPILRAYGKHQQVGMNFPPLKLAQQLAVVYSAPTQKHLLSQAHLGKRQYHETLAKPATFAEEHWVDLLHFVDTLDRDRVEAIVKLPETQDFIAASGNAVDQCAQDTIKDMLTFYAHPPSTLKRRLARHLEEYPELSTAFIKQIL